MTPPRQRTGSSPDTLAHWEAYYRGGSLVSCPVGADPGYCGAVREAWVEFFSELEDGARILDLGTGNGAVALIARETGDACGKRFAIDAIDLADIDPVRDVRDGARLLQNIRFHPRVSCEALPFPSGCMDAISGQYILEYTRIERSLAEMARVLAAGGRCQLIMHSDASVVVRNARDSLEQAHLVERDTKVLALFARFVDAEHTAPNRVEPARRALVEAAGRLHKAADATPGALLLRYVNDSLRVLFDRRGTMPRTAIHAALGDVGRNLRNWRLRLEDLVGAARTHADMERITAQAADAGFESIACATQLQEAVHDIGWRLSMRRRSVELPPP